MASPPAKRQRRSKAVFSDDEEEPETPRREATSRRSASSTATSATDLSEAQKHPKLTGANSKSKRSTATRQAALKSESTSPSKSKKAPRKKRTEENSKSLHSFFGRASEEQRWTRKADTPSEEISDVENGDAIEDDDDNSPEKDFSQLAKRQEDVKFQLDRRKGGATLTQHGFQTNRTGLPASTHKFVKPPVPNANKNGTKFELEDSSKLHRPWADRYSPSSLEELAVHKKKAADVQNWLCGVLTGRNPHKLLVLKGPAGSGKTTTVTLLSKTLNFQALHWYNPTVSDMNMTASVASQFEDFVNRSGHFGSLELGTASSNPFDGRLDDLSELSPRVLVVEEFPTNMTRSSSALEAFRRVLLRYLASSPPASNSLFRTGAASLETSPPVVVIISESLLTSATASADSFTAHRLLGPEITNHPLATVMEFNTVAPTFIAKALDLVIRKEARDSQRRRVPGPAILKKLSEMGDIRSAVNTLELLCARSAPNDDWSGRVAAKMKKSTENGVTLTPMEKSSLVLVTQREATLGMFHAVGKVVYNKREDAQTAEPTAELPPKPPDHLIHANKPKTSQVNIDGLMNETGTDIATFISTLHENYVLSCNGSSFLDSLNSCIDALSDSDALSPEGRYVARGGHGRGAAGNGMSHAGGVDMLRQNEISFHVAVRGLLFGLPHPVNRAAYPGGRKGDAFKMFYPASLRLWKPMEENDSLISTLIDKFICTVMTGKDTGNGVASWKQKINTFAATPEHEEISTTPRILASRTDMLYDRLPYLSKLRISSELDMQKVKQVTQFYGADLQNEDDSDDGGIDAVIDLSAADEITDRATTSPKKGNRILRIGPDRGRGQGAALNKSIDNDVELEKLYISDDDIQDD